MNIGKLKYGIAALLVSLLSACAAIPVTTNVNAALASSVQCHTFDWAGAFRGGPLTATLANPVNEAHLRASIQTHLQSVGVRIEATNPDCLVGYGIGQHGVVADWGWGPGWGPWWGAGWGPYWGGPYIYPEAIVAVDLYDGHSHQPIWHAHARIAPSELSGEHSQLGIDAAVTAIFTKYLH